MPEYHHSHPHDHQHDHEQMLEVSNTLEVTNSERPSYTAHGAAQRQALVEAAYEIIAQEGFEGLRTREVARRAGVNIATLHYYFPHKEDLIRGVMDHIREVFAKRHAPLAAAPTNGLEELRHEIVDQEYLLTETPQNYIVLFELALRSLRDPFIHNIMPRMDANWLQRIRSYLKQGVQQGVFRADLDIETASAALIAFLKGCAIQRMVNPGLFPAERVYAELERWLTGQAPL